MRYHFIVTVTMLTHFCIQAGMPEVQAFDIQDNYIQSADQTHRLVDMEALHDEACMLSFRGVNRVRGGALATGGFKVNDY